jgi:hypothetical protein
VKIIIKKITSLLLLLAVLSPLLFVLSFNIQQQIARHRIKEQLEKQLLHSITIADRDINWIEEGREIWVNGKMFDIETTAHHNGTTTFTGLYDEEETLLVNQLNKHSSNNPLADNRLLNQLFKCLHTIFYTRNHDILFSADTQQFLFNPNHPGLISQFRTIPTPPPQA